MKLNLNENTYLYQQVYNEIKMKILDEVLKENDRLPSSRELASENRVSRNIIVMALNQLELEGFIERIPRGGTYVKACSLPVDLNRKAPHNSRAKSAQPQLSQYGQQLISLEAQKSRHWGFARTSHPYDFRYGVPAFDLFPIEEWNKILRHESRHNNPSDMDYAPPNGLTNLREAISQYLYRSRGIRCDASQVVVVNGTQQAFDLITRILLDPGDDVLIENPRYPGFESVCQLNRAKITHIDIDSQGFNTDLLFQQTNSPKLIYLTPSHQFPCGQILPLARRSALLNWAKENNSFIVEDDYDSEYQFIGRPVPSLKSMDHDDRVIYTGTFSKVLTPSLRIGYVVLPNSLSQAFIAAKKYADIGNSVLQQKVLSKFIRSGLFERHLRRLRKQLTVRRAALIDSLESEFGDRIEIVGANAGMHALVWFNEYKHSHFHRIKEHVSHAGINIYSVSPFYATQPKRLGLLFGFSSMTRDAIACGIKALSSAIKHSAG